MHVNIQTKRFIAGAVCPRCGEMDRLVTYQVESPESEAGQYKECVNCGYLEKQLAQLEQNELPTRVNHQEKESSAGEAINLINFYDAKSNKSDKT